LPGRYIPVPENAPLHQMELSYALNHHAQYFATPCHAHQKVLLWAASVYKKPVV